MRSVADIPGWSATDSHDGRTTAVALRRDGLVQSFAVPAGTSLVTFRYNPPGLHTGIVTSAAGLGALLVLGLAALAIWARRRRSRPALDAAARAG